MRLVATLSRSGLALALVVAAAGWADASSFDRAARPARTRDAAATRCRRNPLLAVHDPTRLKTLHACVTFVGTVSKAPRRFADGDVGFNAKPDAAYASMLNDKNRREGGIHVEIIPIDRPGGRSGCSGAKLVFPPKGAHVRVTGAHVYDSWVGWNEIHPAGRSSCRHGTHHRRRRHRQASASRRASPARLFTAPAGSHSPSPAERCAGGSRASHGSGGRRGRRFGRVLRTGAARPSSRSAAATGHEAA